MKYMTGMVHDMIRDLCDELKEFPNVFPEEEDGETEEDVEKGDEAVR